jgi:hypothetical protein
MERGKRRNIKKEGKRQIKRDRERKVGKKKREKQKTKSKYNIEEEGRQKMSVNTSITKYRTPGVPADSMSWTEMIFALPASRTQKTELLLHWQWWWQDGSRRATITGLPKRTTVCCIPALTATTGQVPQK